MRFRLLSIAALLLLTPTPVATTPDPPATDSVVLLHGFGRSERSMRMFERELRQDGYQVCNIGYPSWEEPLSAITSLVADEVERCGSAPDAKVHFVTHSMGGIVARSLLTGPDRPGNLGRVVMLAPPNGGSELADPLRDNPTLRQLAGPAAVQLGTGPDNAPHRLGPPDFELGVLMGNWSWNPIGSWLIPGDDDGTVSVESAHIEGMADFRLLPATHTYILRSHRALAEVRHFLSQGRFSDASTD